MKKLAFEIGVLLLAATVSAGESDRKIGTAIFKIGRKNNNILVEPMQPPVFRVQMLKGDGIEPATITKCTIYAHPVESYTTTILKCGQNEYGISGVDFVTENAQ